MKKLKKYFLKFKGPFTINLNYIKTCEKLAKPQNSTMISFELIENKSMFSNMTIIRPVGPVKVTIFFL